MKREDVMSFREVVKKKMQQVDWSLLIFLVLILNVKLIVKVAAVCFAFIHHRRSLAGTDWRLPGTGGWRSLMGVRRKGDIAVSPARVDGIGSTHGLFYASMLLLAAINLVLSVRSLSAPSLLAFAAGCGYWLLAMSAAWLVLLFVRQVPRESLHATMDVFFIVHLLFILAAFVWICIDARTTNPYTFTGLHQKYYISTGDFIQGLTFDSSVTGAMISAFGLFYFLYRGRWGLSLCCMIAVLMAGSNFINIMLLALFLFVFVFRSDRIRKSMIVVYVLAIVIFWGKVSPQNKSYSESLISQLAGKKNYPPPYIAPHPRDIDLVEKKDVVTRKATLLSFMDTLYTPAAIDSLKRGHLAWERSGKIIAWQELGSFLKIHPGKILLGAGMGNFSSRLAYRTTGLGIAGGYPFWGRYLSPFFRDNYLYIYLYYYTRDQGRQSMANRPDSVYSQLLGEYGLAGLLSFVFLYLVFFGRDFRSLTYGLPLLILMGAAFFVEYWFEQVSIVVLFELLLLLDKKDIYERDS